MKLKLDENLGYKILQIFSEDHEDVATVHSQKLSGKPDDSIAQICREEERILITMDHHFGNLIRFPLKESPGIVILEPEETSPYSCLQEIAKETSKKLLDRPIVERLWIAKPGYIRVRPSIEIQSNEY